MLRFYVFMIYDNAIEPCRSVTFSITKDIYEWFDNFHSDV